MDNKRIFTEEELHYLRLLARQYPTVEAAGTEIIRLQAILNLPKPTEHFMSDIHGEHEAFLHILTLDFFLAASSAAARAAVSPARIA